MIFLWPGSDRSKAQRPAPPRLRTARCGDCFSSRYPPLPYFPALKGDLLWDDADHIPPKPSMQSLHGLLEHLV